MKMVFYQAYRNIPIHQEDHSLLGVEWQGVEWQGVEWQVVVYVDTVLTFSLRSALLLFTVVGDALQCQWGVSWLGHYIDDYVTMGAAGRQECLDG